MRLPAWQSLTLLSLSACLTAGCGATCVDDGPVWQQNKCNAASAGDSATDTDGSTESAGASDSDPTDTASASQSGSQSASPSGSQSASDTNPTASDSVSASASDSDTASATDTASASDSDTDSASDSDSITASASDTSSGATEYCVDADQDGAGDPEQCSPVDPGDEPPPGSVPNGDDCDDTDPETFRGAAENEDPDACMTDADKDGWGDSDPGRGVEPGTDCNDDDSNTFPGAAEKESDASACMTDADGDDYGDDAPEGGAVPGTDCDDSDVATFPGAAEKEADAKACTRDNDGDGWGDAAVPDGVVGGLDCHDNNPLFNPTDRVLFTLVDNLPGVVSQIDVDTGLVTPYATLVPPVGLWSIYSAAVSPVDGLVYAHNSAAGKTRLITFDYCMEGSMPKELMNHGQSICGLAFDNDGVLYGIDSGKNHLVTFDTATGAITSSKQVKVGNQNLDIASCGMAYDCVGDRLLLTQGDGSRIYAIDAGTAAATELADPLGGNWSAVGAEYDVVSQQMLVVDGADFFQVKLDGSDDVTDLDNLSLATNDLTYGPVCL